MDQHKALNDIARAREALARADAELDSAAVHIDLGSTRLAYTAVSLALASVDEARNIIHFRPKSTLDVLRAEVLAEAPVSAPTGGAS